MVPQGAAMASAGRVARTRRWWPMESLGNPRITDQPDVLLGPVVRDERDIIEQGGRASNAFLFYDTSTKATLVAGPGSGHGKAQGVVAGAGRYVVWDLDGILPLDEWTIEVPFLSVGQDLTAQPAGDIYLLTAQAGGINQQRFSIRRTGAGTLHTFMYVNGAMTGQAALNVSVGDVPADTWHVVSVTYKRSQAKPLRIYLDNNIRASVSAGETASGGNVWTRPWSGFVASGTGLALGTDLQGSADASVLQIGMPTVRRKQMTPAAAISFQTPTVTVDPSVTQGPMPDLAGVLHQANGSTAQGHDVTGVLLDEIAGLVTAAGGRRFRIEHILDKAIITGTGAAPVYDWSPLWDRMDPIAAGGGTFDLTLGYTPSVLGTPYQPPSNNAQFAQICLAFMTAAVARYPGRVLSWSLWNEPNLVNFWSGTSAQLVALWAAVHDVLDPAFPDILTGATECSGWVEGASAMTLAIIDRAATDGRRLDHVRWHDYSGDLWAIPTNAAALRAYCTAKTDTGDYVGAAIKPAVTEWNWSVHDNTQWEGGTGAFAAYRAPASRTEKIAAFVYAFLAECLAADYAFVSFTRSGILFDGPDAGYEAHMGLFGLPTPADPLPAFGAHEAWWMTRGLTRISAAVNGWPGLRAVAATDSESGRIVITGGTWRPGQRDGKHPVHIAIDDLPDHYSWRYWQLDRSSHDDGRLLLSEAGDTASGDALPLGRSLSNMGVFALEIAPA